MKLLSRKDFAKANRILIKVGTTVVTQPDLSFALGRLGGIIEDISELVKAGKEVLMVTSGSVGKGSQKLYQQYMMSLPLHQFYGKGPNQTNFAAELPPRACAAAGQSGLMSLYEDMFGQKGISISQVLLTENDFRDEKTILQLRETFDTLLKWKILPIINENDVVSMRTTPIRDEDNRIFWDNDSLASLIARETKTDLLLLLSDVDGIYTKSPDEPGAKFISVYRTENNIVFGQKSRMGRGGMKAKIEAAVSAVDQGVPSVVIASGHQPHTISKIMKGKRVGTWFSPNPPEENDPYILTHNARKGSLLLRALTGSERSQILLDYSKRLLDNKKDILDANEKDFKESSRHGLASPLLARLKLSSEKIDVLAKGIEQIASKDDPIGYVTSRTEISENLILEKLTSPIGVLLVIFESRPDALPQLVALSIKSGNGLILKGGKEAHHSNKILYKLAGDSIQSITEKASVKVPREVIGLVHSKEEVAPLLQMEKEIDLVIPRGSSSMVKHIQKKTKIPVLGHAEGVCHIYLHEDANMQKAERILIDAKLDYPAACNSVETLLINTNLIKNGRAFSVLKALVSSKVELFTTEQLLPLLNQEGINAKLLTHEFHHEYSDTKLTVVSVESVIEAVDHINTFGSGHTESIITEDVDTSDFFQKNVDSACVFLNASTRFADGYRFGLGAEVGISTNRLHARGPVGIDGLLTTKWVLTSKNKKGDIVSEFTKGERIFTHSNLPLKSKL